MNENMFTYKSIEEIIKAAEKEQKNISDIIINDQAIELNSSVLELYKKMADNLAAMKESIEEGLSSTQKSISGLSGGNAVKLKQHAFSVKCCKRR